MVRPWPSNCVAVAIGALGMTMPDPEHIVMLLGATGLGVGIGVGAGYAAFLSRTSAAKIQAYKLWDEAHRQSTQYKLELAVRQHQEAMDQIDQNARLLQKLRDELEEERSKSDKLEADLVAFATRVLTDKGFLEPRKQEPHES
jgi:hypothetical protein